MTDRESAADVGEFALIERIRGVLPRPPADETWSGDDAAVVLVNGTPVVFTTDMLVEGVDFDLAYSDPVDVGWKAVAVNASDVAAMGGRAERAVCALALPSSTPSVLVQDLARGLEEAGRRLGVLTVGGDVSSASEISLSVAVIGPLPGPAVTRTRAARGDLICVTGTLGGAGGGLFVLANGIAPAGELRDLVARQSHPIPRLQEGPALAAVGVSSMIDVSDGLVADLGHLLAGSSVGCRVDPERVPVEPALRALASLSGAPAPLELALAGGEDYELLFTIAQDRLDDVRAAVGDTDVTVIGRIEEGDRLIGGERLDRWENKGWQHLRRP